jgi:hypothetical protein
MPIVSDQIYSLGQEPLLIQYKAFEVLPEYFIVGPSSVEAYLYTGISLLPPIDMTCHDLISIRALSWISFD